MLIEIGGIISKISHCGVDLIDTITVSSMISFFIYAILFLDTDCLVAHIRTSWLRALDLSVVRFGISVDDNDNIKPGRITMKPGSKSQSLWVMQLFPP